MSIMHVTHKPDGTPISRKITKIEPRFHGHLHLTFEDGSHEVIVRGQHEKHELLPGDYWPPPAAPEEPPAPSPVKPKRSRIRKLLAGEI